MRYYELPCHKIYCSENKKVIDCYALKIYNVENVAFNLIIILIQQIKIRNQLTKILIRKRNRWVVKGRVLNSRNVMAGRELLCLSRSDDTN